MQKYIVPIIFVVVFVSLYVFKTIRQFNENNILSSGTQIKATPTPLRLPHGIIMDTQYSKNKYLVFSIKIPNGSKISLIPNFSEKLIGEKLVEENNCDAAINGGFYLGNDKPLGLFVIEENEIGHEVKSSIANSFVWQDRAGDIKFIRSVPESFSPAMAGDPAEAGKFTDFIFQSGPYIIPQNRPLKLVRDERSRRSLLGKDFQGNLYFITVTNKENLVGGPHLSDIPIIFWELKQK